jgi:integrase
MRPFSHVTSAAHKPRGEREMSGHIRKREIEGGSRYYPVLEVDGKQRTFGSFKTKRDALAKLRTVEKKAADGTLDQEKAPTFGVFYERWIAAKEKSLKAATLVDYRHTFANHILPFFADKRIDAIKPMDVQEWVHSCRRQARTPAEDKEPMELSPASTAKCFRYFRACMRQAETWGEIEKSPCRGIELPRVNREELEYLQPVEIAALIAECREPERTLITVLAYSGLRLGEGLALRWRDVDFEMNAIKVERSYSIYNGFTEPKTYSSRRAVSMFPSLAACLRDFYRLQGNPAPDALLFTLNGKTPLDKGNVRRQFYAALEAAGLKHVSVHSLRHSFASVMLASGASVKALATCLGHSSPVMTLNVYSHLITESVEPVLMKADALMTGAGGKIIQLEERGRH